MGTGYTRNDTGNNIATGNTIDASDLDGEYDAIEAAFNASTGHTHDGTAAEGAPVEKLGPSQDFIATATDIRPKATNTLDIGTSGAQFKDLYIDGVAYVDGFAEDTLFATDKKVQFRDAGLFINSSTNGQLDIDADTELELTAPTLDVNAATAVTVDTASYTLTATNFAFVGAGAITGDLDVDNLNLNGNTLISTNTNGAINITPNGTGAVVVSKIDVAAGEIDGTVIGANSAAAATFTNLTASGTVTLTGATIANGGTVTTIDIDGGTIDGVTIGGASAGVGTFTTLTATTTNATTVDTTNIEVTNIKAKDGTAAGSIANTTGVVTLASSVLTTTDINGGTIDGATIGGASAGAGTFTNLTANGTITLTGATVANGGSVTTVDINGGTIDGTTIGGSSAAVGTFTTANATTVDTTNLEVTTLKAKDGTSAGSIADATGVVTIASAVLTTADINGGTVDAVVGGTTPAAGTFTVLTANTSLGVTGNITVSGTVDGRDVATDGTKLDGIEASADVTDATNVASAGAVMADGTGNDLTGDIVFSEKADHSSTPSAGKGYIWVKNDTPSSLIFTDDAGTDHTVAPASSSGIGSVVEDTTPQLGGTLDANGNSIQLDDNGIVAFGTAQDAEFFTDGIDFYLDLNAGINNFIIRDATTTRFTFDDAGDFTATGDVTAYSDRSLKDDVRPITDALDKVDQINGVTFVRNDMDSDARKTGVIAQDVEAVLPEVVSTDENGIKSVAYGNMVGLLIEAIKELREEVRILKGEIQ